MDRKLQRHRADSLRQHGFLVLLLLTMPQQFYLDETVLHAPATFGEA